ncbi:MAG: hypothetical protein M3540_09810 [Actinomycetota bacterium]|nr:hypothetical protein [Actinomycetota bacterium]
MGEVGGSPIAARATVARCSGSRSSGRPAPASRCSRASSGGGSACLDVLFWRAGWVEPDRAEWEALNRELVQAERWILDGNYGSTMEIRLAAADTVVFLDPPPLLCIWRVVRRRRAGPRPDLPPYLDERVGARDFLAFLAYTWRYRRTRRPGVEERIARHRGGKKVHVLRSRRDVDRFLAVVSGP